MKRFLLVLSVCVLTLGQVLAQSQTISGKVVSAADGEGIPGASISMTSCFFPLYAGSTSRCVRETITGMTRRNCSSRSTGWMRIRSIPPACTTASGILRTSRTGFCLPKTATGTFPSLRWCGECRTRITRVPFSRAEK